MSGNIHDITFSPDGLVLASAGSDDKVGLWEVATARRIAMLAGHRGSPGSVGFVKDGSGLVSASYGGGELGFWNLEGLVPKVAVNHRKEDLRQTWERLRSVDGMEAVVASRRFLLEPEKALELLNGMSFLPRVPDATEVRRLVRSLDDDAYSTRIQAHAKLAEVADSIEPLLREALASSKNIETGRRLEALLKGVTLWNGMTRDEVRLLRLLFLLRQMPCSQSTATLQRLAHELKNSRLHSEVKEAIAACKR